MEGITSRCVEPSFVVDKNRNNIAAFVGFFAGGCTVSLIFFQVFLLLHHRVFLKTHVIFFVNVPYQ